MRSKSISKRFTIQTIKQNSLMFRISLCRKRKRLLKYSGFFILLSQYIEFSKVNFSSFLGTKINESRNSN